MSGKSKDWYGFDLDGTLAKYEKYKTGAIGPPIPNIVQRVKQYLAMGRDVRIFTARVSVVPGEENTSNGGILRKQENERAIKLWCLQVFGRELPMTCSKDRHCCELWDDIAKQVVTDTGEVIEDTLEMYRRYKKAKE